MTEPHEEARPAEHDDEAPDASATPSTWVRHRRAWVAGGVAAVVLVGGGTAAGIALSGGSGVNEAGDTVALASPGLAATSSAAAAADPAYVAPAPTAHAPTMAPTAASGPTGGNPFATEIWGSNAVPFVAPRAGSYGSAALTPRSAGSVRLQVPASWQYTDESSQAGRSDGVFYDPANPAARVEVSLVRCTGCVTDSAGHPAPKQALPPATTSSFAFNGGQSVGFREADADGYGVNGVVDVVGGGSPGYVIVRVALPQADTPVATKILNSVQVG
jgi:hypothetical protein